MTVLLVDDDASVRMLMASALTRQGFQVSAASGAQEALDRFAALDGKVDVLVTDVMMPDMNGFDLARSLSMLNSSLPVVFVSGFCEAPLPSGESQSLDTAMHSVFVQKPFRIDEFLEAVGSVLVA